MAHTFLCSDKLSGLYLTTSHAAQVNSPVTFEVVPIMLHNHIVESSPSVKTIDVHYLWLFGDEVTWNLMLFDKFNVDGSKILLSILLPTASADAITTRRLCFRKIPTLLYFWYQPAQVKPVFLLLHSAGILLRLDVVGVTSAKSAKRPVFQ